MKDIRIRQLGETDVGALRTLAKSCPPLGVHTAFTYWVVSHYFGDYSYLACDAEDQPIGYIMCITKRDDPDLIYIWQVGVLQGYRRHKLAMQLLEELYQKRIRSTSISRIQVTIDPSNIPSNQLFKSFAEAHGFGYKIMGEAKLVDPIDGVSESENLIEITV